jgi:ATPase subunit of ABC transporter with duplicated ATPase domains
LEEHELKIRLNRFLFTKDSWNKPCNVLSGGERMRLTLCCLTISLQPPDIIILDEPTNNLDLQNIAILTHAVKAYEGTLIVISHDEQFLEEIRIDTTVGLC